MTALVVTIIALLLVGAIAAATVYYGGSSFTDARRTADATRLINEGQQVRAAVDMHKQRYHTGVNDLEELVTKEFLNAVPPSSWTSVNGYAISTVSDKEMCLEANRKMGVNGIPNCADPRIANNTLCCTTVDADVVTP